MRRSTVAVYIAVACSTLLLSCGSGSTQSAGGSAAASAAASDCFVHPAPGCPLICRLVCTLFPRFCPPVCRQLCPAPPVCGNGRLDAGELCDTGIAAGQAGACPTSCSAPDACETAELQGGGTCQATCVNHPVTYCVHGDGCCPAGCTVGNDCDCLPAPEPCTPANVCHVGTTACTAAGIACVDTGAGVPDGTACGAGLVCTAGLCVPASVCVPGASCTPVNPCHTGAVDCSSGAPVCLDTGTSLPDGTSQIACPGPIPQICATCSDGRIECAHYVCTQGQCSIGFCPGSS